MRLQTYKIPAGICNFVNFDSPADYASAELGGVWPYDDDLLKRYAYLALGCAIIAGVGLAGIRAFFFCFLCA